MIVSALKSVLSSVVRSVIGNEDDSQGPTLVLDFANNHYETKA